MRRLKTIDELYEEVKGYDLVITNDIALETALNSRISVARVGFFAMTPRHIAVHETPVQTGKGPVKDIELITIIRDETGMDLRHIFSEIQNIREIRRYTPEVRQHLNSKDARAVYDSYEAVHTVDRIMSSFVPEESGFYKTKDRIALVGVELFDDLDKHFSPLDCDFIDIFADEDYEIEEIREVGSDRQLAENAVDLIDPDRADDYAIVMNPTSPIADAVRAALYSKGIHFINKMTVKEMAPIRDYLSLLTFAFNYETVRVKHVKELFAAYNGFFRRGLDEYLLSRVSISEDSNSERYRELMREICDVGITFGEASERFLNNSVRPHVKTLLNQLDMYDKGITPNELANLRYAVENLADLTNSEETPDYERDGVLLADCSNSVFVDRPVVIYLGMGQDWNKNVAGKRYLDAEEESMRNAQRLEGLLQQGQRRVYMVNSTKNGKKARPSVQFDLIFGRPCETFADICGRLVPGRWASPPEKVEFDHGEEVLDSPSGDKPFSKSSFNAYYYCPRKYMFNTLLSDAEKKSTEFGNLIHAFAELYVCHGDYVRSHGIDGFIDSVSEKYAGLSAPSMTALDHDAIRRAMSNVMAYLDGNGVRDPPLDTLNSSRREEHRNVFMNMPELDACTTLCESDRESKSHHIHGHFDLLWKDTVVDYKTGKPKSLREIGQAMEMGNDLDYPEFQPLIYLALASRPDSGELPARRFDLFYVMDHDVSSGSGDFDITSNVRTVRLETGDAMSIARESPAFLEDLTDDLSKDFKDKSKQLLDAIEAHARPDPSGWQDDDVLIMHVLEHAGMRDNESNRKKAKGAVGKVAKRLAGGMIRTEDEIIVPSATLERFLEQVSAMHDEAMACFGNDYPASPRNGCENCEFKEVCTRTVITDEGGGFDE